MRRKDDRSHRWICAMGTSGGKNCKARALSIAHPCRARTPKAARRRASVSIVDGIDDPTCTDDGIDKGPGGTRNDTGESDREVLGPSERTRVGGDPGLEAGCECGDVGREPEVGLVG